MRVTLRQGITRHPHSGVIQQFLQVSGSFINLTATNGSTEITFAYKTADYFLSEDLTVSNAWGPFTIIQDHWLYWDINLRSGIRTFGYTTSIPIVSPTEPSLPSADQHWFDLTTNTMRVRNGSSWREVVRVFAARYDGSSLFSMGPGISSMTFAGSQVGITGSFNAGVIIFDDGGRPIQKTNGTFITSEDHIIVRGAKASAVTIDQSITTLEAAENIAAYKVVKLSSFGKILLAGYNDIGTTMLYMVTEGVSTGSVTNGIAQGVVTNINWNWTTPGATLWVSTAGDLVEIDPITTSPALYPTRKVPVARVLTSTSIFFEQGLGGIGDIGPPGPGTILASTTAFGITKISVPPILPTSPVAVGDNDPRMTDARTPLPHDHDTAYVNVTGDTMTGALAMGGFKVSGLAAATVNGDAVRFDEFNPHIANATVHFTEASINHANILNVGTNTHAQIDTHIASVSNPHLTTLLQLTDTPVSYAGQSGKVVTIKVTEDGVEFTTPVAGVTDHGALTGLGDDDHPQYHNDLRGDIRYYTKTLLDAGQLDTRYYTESETNALLVNKQPIDAGLTSVAGLSFTSTAFVKMTAVDTFTLDTNTYEPANANIQAHIVSVSNPHSVTKAQVGLGNVENLKVNLTAVTDPAVSSDNTEGYAIGSIWINVTLDKQFICTDATTGSALWKETTGGGITDHGILTGLADDDHLQYHNDVRGDARYYTETELNAGQLDTRYYTESETDTLLLAKQPLDSTLTSLATFNANGLLTQTAADTFTGRTITAGTGISVLDGNGVAGNPTLSVVNNTTTQRVEVVKNSGAVVGTRKQLNFIEGSNVTLTIADDVGNDQVDITVASTDTGEANTASNVGVGGVGVFKQKTGIDLEFKNINAGSNKITITNDVGNNEVDIDVVPANISHTGLADIGTNTHAQIDTHIADSTVHFTQAAISIPSTQISDFTEATQDAVGTILTDTSTVNLNYDDGLNQITATVLPAGVDHNTLANLTTGDPHTQYVLDAGDTMTGTLNIYPGTDVKSLDIIGSYGGTATLVTVEAGQGHTANRTVMQINNWNDTFSTATMTGMVIDSGTLGAINKSVCLTLTGVATGGGSNIGLNLAGTLDRPFVLNNTAIGNPTATFMDIQGNSLANNYDSTTQQNSSTSATFQGDLLRLRLTGTRSTRRGRFLRIGDAIDDYLVINKDGALVGTRAITNNRFNAGVIHNLLTFSEDLTNAAWVKTNVTITGNNANSPDGGALEADLFTTTVANGTCVQTTTGTTASKTFTFSCWVDRVGTTNLSLRIDSDNETGTAVVIAANIIPTGWIQVFVHQTFTAGSTGAPKAVIIGTTATSTANFFGFNLSETSDIIGYTKTTTTAVATKTTGLVANGVLLTTGYTVATLPVGVVGANAYVTDALAPAYNVAVVGGGAVTIPVFFNGASWVTH